MSKRWKFQQASLHLSQSSETDLEEVYALLFRVLGNGFRQSLCNVGWLVMQKFIILVPDPIVYAPWSVLLDCTASFVYCQHTSSQPPFAVAFPFARKPIRTISGFLELADSNLIFVAADFFERFEFFGVFKVQSHTLCGRTCACAVCGLFVPTQFHFELSGVRDDMYTLNFGYVQIFIDIVSALRPNTSGKGWEQQRPAGMNNLERDSKQYDVLVMETSTQEKTVRDSDWCVPAKHVAKLQPHQSNQDQNIKFFVDPEEEDRDHDTTPDCLGSKQFALEYDVGYNCSCCEADGTQWKRTRNLSTKRPSVRLASLTDADINFFEKGSTDLCELQQNTWAPLPKPLVVDSGAGEKPSCQWIA